MALALMQWVMIGAYAVFLEEEHVRRPGRALLSATRWIVSVRPRRAGHVAARRAPR
jgi:hypothetical protein